ncbi:ComF family protein [candidate division TA06 bacterium]|nr:ComF family protein [candidate division TA06 bacterium]
MVKFTNSSFGDLQFHSPITALLDFFFPPFCAICNERLNENEKTACEECWQSIHFITPPFCQRCGTPMTKRKCGKCVQSVSLGPPDSDAVGFQFFRGRSLGVYEGVLSDIVKLIKFHRKTSLAKRAGRMMGTLLQSDSLLQEGEVLIPVPLHKTRLRERGYNQALLLAEAIFHSTSIPVAKNLLLRRRATKPQTDLRHEERMENVKGAFGVMRNKEIQGKKVILVDDVFTTGSTLQACTEALLEGGAVGVYCLTASMTI